MAEQTVESLQIIVDANVKKAWTQLDALQKRLGQLQSQVNKSFAPKMDAMKSAMQSAAAPMEKVAAEVKKSSNQIAKEQAKLQADLRVIEEKAQAQIATALLQEEAHRVRAQEVIGRQAEAQRRLAEVSSATANKMIQDQRDIEAAVAKATARLQEQVSAATSTITGGDVPHKGSKTATQIFAEREQPKTSSPNYYVPENERQAQQLTGLQAIAAKYYAALDRIKMAFDKIGSSSKESMAKATAAMDGARKNTDKATAATKKYGKQATSTGKSASKSFLSLGNVIKVALLAAMAKALKALKEFVKKGIQLAISAPEIENMFNVAFGSAAAAADEFAQKLKSAFGVDKMASKQMLATFQNFNVSMGVGQQTAVKMSKSLTQLTYDMASLYEADPQQVFENLQSGLQGMPRALYKYGISITEANVKQTALTHGIIQQGEEMNEQQKIIARYITILQQTGTSQGDLARTMQSPANLLRIFKSQMEAAGRAIGQAFMPFIQAVLPWINTLAVVLERAGNALARFTFRLFGRDFDAEMKAQQDALKGMQDSAAGAGNAQDELGDKTEEAAKKAEGALASFDKLNVIQKKQADNAGAGAGDGFDFAVPELPEPTGQSPFEKMADDLLKKLKEIKDKMMDLGLKEVLDNFKDFFAAIKQQIDQYDFATAIKDALWNGFELAMSLINAAQRIVFPIVIALDIPGIVYEAINTLSSLFAMLNNAVRAVTPGLEAFVQIGLVPIAEWLGGKIRDGLKFLQEQFEKIGAWFTAHTSDFTAFGEALGNLTNALWEVIEPLLDTAWSTFKGIISGIVDIVLKIADALLTTLTPVINAIADWVRENSVLIQDLIIIVGSFAAAWGLVNGAIAIWNGLVAVFNAVMGIGAAVTTAFGAAMAFLASPIGIAVVIIGAIIAVVVLLIKHWDDLQAAAKKAMDKIQTDVAAFSIAFSVKSKETTEKVKTDFAAFALAFTLKAKETWETAKTDFFAFALTFAAKAKETWEEVKTGIALFMAAVKTKWDQGWSDIGNKFSSVWNGISSTASRVVDTIKNAVSGLIDKIKDGINGLKELLGLNEQTRYSNAPSQTGRMSSPSGRSSLSPYVQGATLNPVRLAQGGVLRRDTLMLGGEYAGASSNPEIVSPQNIMYETVVKANAASNNALMRKLDQVIQAIGKIDPTIKIGDDEIHASWQREDTRRGNMFSMV